MIRALLVFLLFALQVSQAYAWNALGHKVVAEIAWRQLSPADRQRIVEVSAVTRDSTQLTEVWPLCAEGPGY